MAIVFDSDAGTITGISVGGLPDGVVDAGTLASNAVTEAKIASSAVVTAKLNDDAVTNAKMANDAITEHELAASAVVTAAINDDAITSAKMASGVGGKILQVVVGEDSTSTTVATGTFTDVGLSATITPASGTKVLVQWTTYYHDANSGGSGSGMRLKRDSTAIYTTTDNNTYMYSSGNLNAIRWQVVHTHLDTHGADGSTAVTYTAQVLAYLSNTLTFNVNNSQTQMVLMEIDS